MKCLRKSSPAQSLADKLDARFGRKQKSQATVQTAAQTVASAAAFENTATQGRVEPIHETTIGLLFSIVDLYDEISLIAKNEAGDSLRNLNAIKDKLRDKIELAGGALLKADRWSPASQRAVKVEAAQTAQTGQTGIMIVKSLSSGLAFQGKILRKEEVIISQPLSIN